jgi:hypothetical protein
MLLACWALIASFLTAYYWIQDADVRNRVAGVLISVDLGVDYGNGSRIWQNNTKGLTGQTLFDVTKQVANVTYQTGMLGTEILSINGVSKQGAFGWTYWVWNSTDHSYSIVWENVDKHLVANEETYVWYYQNSFNPPP